MNWPLTVLWISRSTVSTWVCRVFVGLVAAQFGDQRIEQAEAVAKFFGGCAHGGIDVASGEAVDRQRMNQAQRHRLVMLAGDGVFDAGFQHLAAIDDRPDLGNGAEGSVLLERIPVAVEGDQAGLVLRHVLAQDALHAHGQGLEHLALFHHGDPLEGVDVIGMHREEPDELVHAFVEPAVVFGERRQVVADLGLLLGGLLEQTLGHHELDIAAGDEDLLEAVLHPADAVGDKGEARAVENGFLDTGHEAEAQILADLADLAEEVEVEDQFLVLAGAQVSRAAHRPPAAGRVRDTPRRTWPSCLRRPACGW